VLGANDRIRVGMIGVGDRGNDLLGQILKVNGVEVVAMADVYSRRRDQAKSRVPGIQTVDDHRRLLDMKEIDAVIVASPLHIHTRHFLDTLAAGKDLYAEKTMTWSIPEADKVMAAAKASNRIIQIGLQHQSSGALVDAKQMIKDGRVGKITHVESWMSRNTPHGKGQWVRQVPSDCTAQNVNWPAFLNGRPDRPFDPFKLINWRLFWEFAGGNCAENMVHQIAWIMGALDLPLPSAAYMSGGVFSEKDGREVPDTIAVTLDFPDTVVTWQSTFSNKHYELGDRILGSDGTSSTTSTNLCSIGRRRRIVLTVNPNGARRTTATTCKTGSTASAAAPFPTRRRKSATARRSQCTCRICRIRTSEDSRWKKQRQLLPSSSRHRKPTRRQQLRRKRAR